MNAAPVVTHAAALPAGEAFFTKAEMARLLKVSLRTLNSMMQRGEVPYLKLRGRLVRFRLEDVNRRLTETVLVCHAAPEAKHGKAGA